MKRRVAGEDKLLGEFCIQALRGNTVAIKDHRAIVFQGELLAVQSA
jgi:hypothetical protein